MKRFMKTKVVPQVKNDVKRFLIPSSRMLKYGDNIADSRFFLFSISFHSDFKLRKIKKPLRAIFSFHVYYKTPQ